SQQQRGQRRRRSHHPRHRVGDGTRGAGHSSHHTAGTNLASPPPMTPELALTELRRGLEVALWVGGPLLLAMLAVGVVVGIIQAATQINEPTIAFVTKAITLTAALFALGSFLLAYLVDYTVTLFQRIPHLIG